MSVDQESSGLISPRRQMHPFPLNTNVEVFSESDQTWYSGCTITDWDDDSGVYSVSWPSGDTVQIKYTHVRREVKWKPVKHTAAFDTRPTRSAKYVSTESSIVQAAPQEAANEEEHLESKPSERSIGPGWVNLGLKSPGIPKVDEEQPLPKKRLPQWKKNLKKYEKSLEEKTKDRPPFNLRGNKAAGWAEWKVDRPVKEKDPSFLKLQKYWGRFAPEEAIEKEEPAVKRLRPPPSLVGSGSNGHPSPEPVRPSTGSARPSTGSKAGKKKAGSPGQPAPLKKAEKVDWAAISAQLPTGEDSNARAQRRVLFDSMDGNASGRLSLAEVDGGIRDILQLPQVFQAKPAIMEAFKAAKSLSPGGSDDYIDYNEFRVLLVALRHYFELFTMFGQIDTGSDRRIDLGEFKQAAHLLREWGATINDPEAVFREIDVNGGGQILFDEFAKWAIRQGLDVKDDDEVEELAPEEDDTA